METLNYTDSRTNDFAAYLEAQLKLQPAHERVMAPELLYTQPEAVDHTAEDFEVWSGLFNGSKEQYLAPNFRQPVEEILARHPVPEKRRERISAAARSLGRIATGAVEWLKDRKPEISFKNPRTMRVLGSATGLAMGMAVTGGVAHNMVESISEMSSTIFLTEEPAKPVQQSVGPAVPQIEFNGIPDAPVIDMADVLAQVARNNAAAAEAAQPKIDLQAIYQETIVRNALLDQQKAEAEAKIEAAKAAAAETRRTVVSGDKYEWMKEAGIAESDMGHVDSIMTGESHWRADAVNYQGCIGVGQNCPDKNGYYWLKAACADWKNDIVCQLKRFQNYAEERYGNWRAARQFRDCTGTCYNPYTDSYIEKVETWW